MLAGVPFVCLFVLVAWPAWVHAQDSVSDQVGATAGQFRVDESGAATYSVPIQAVPGTAGVAPDISLNYSSQGGDGPLGRGWAVGGS
ncbi:MAG: SpvB/TcaC N-terminal domain-containing protein [Lysobacteraceae bacterium]